MSHKPTKAKRKVKFFLNNVPEATKVGVAGDFNGWQTEAHPLKHNRDGTWTTTLSLLPGTYQYRFFVDGEWCDDPTCAARVDNEFGSQNCVIVVE